MRWKGDESHGPGKESMNLSPANLGTLNKFTLKEILKMKKMFRILAVVLAATMLMCCCAFAMDSSKDTTDEGNMRVSFSYDCFCGQTVSSAYTQTSNMPWHISVSFSGSVFYNGGDELPIGASCSDVDVYVYCSDSYSSAKEGHIESTHEVNNDSVNDYAFFIN